MKYDQRTFQKPTCKNIMNLVEQKCPYLGIKSYENHNFLLTFNFDEIINIYIFMLKRKFTSQIKYEKPQQAH